MLNYISLKLKQSVDNTYALIDENDKKIINNKVSEIRKYFDEQFNEKKFAKYGDLTLNTDYFLKMRENVKLKHPIIGFVSSNEIAKLLNVKLTYSIKFYDNILNVIFYHNNNDDIVILNNNIQKIITRIYNLCVLYRDKKYVRFGKNTTLLNYDFVFYLYNNPRRSNRNLSGEKYLDEIADSHVKCFNVSSGMTSSNNLITYISRTEEAIGLLTHEVLHCVSIMYMIDNYSKKNFNIFEMFTNAFASIIHSYLYSYETDTKITENLFLEFMHTILHSVRISLNVGKTIFDVINDKQGNGNWHQNALLYEYVNGRLLILLNFEHLMNKYRNMSKNLLSLDKGWDMYDDKLIIDAHNAIDELHDEKFFDKNNKLFLKSIHDIFLKLVNSDNNVENNNIIGNMIQQYFLLDPLEIEEKKILHMLYGGKVNFYEKYVKYNNKIYNIAEKK